MFGATTILASLLAFSTPPETPSVVSAPSDQVCTSLPPAPSNVDVVYFDDVRADGTRGWSAAATYELSTGDLGEAYLEGDSAGNGEVYFVLNGTIVTHTKVTIDEETDGMNTSSWSPYDSDYSPELLAELMHPRVVDVMVNGMGPEEFKCSNFGKKVMKAVKYAVYGAATAITAACCGTVTPGCLVCAFSAGSGAAAAGDAFDNYCE
jgi:hypothetical protein